MSTYILQKDLPDYEAGEEFVYSKNSLYYEASNTDKDGCRGKWPPSYVENNPEWFKLKEDNVLFISWSASVHNKSTGYFSPMYHDSLELKTDLTHQQFDDIKNAIQDILNLKQ